MFALTVRQPWAWAIMHGGKNVENRTWNTRIRGRIAIHAGATFGTIERMDIQAIREIYRQLGRDPDSVPYPRPADDLPTAPYALGAIIGTADLVDCVTAFDSPWFFGPHGFLLANREPLPRPIPYKGRQGFFGIDDLELAA